MKVFDLRCWRWLAMIFVATVVVACSEDDYDYNPAPADKTIVSITITEDCVNGEAEPEIVRGKRKSA